MSEQSNKDEVLKVYPDAYESRAGWIWEYNPRERGYGNPKLLGYSWTEAHSRLPNAPAPHTNCTGPCCHPELYASGIKGGGQTRMANHEPNDRKNPLIRCAKCEWETDAEKSDSEQIETAKDHARGHFHSERLTQEDRDAQLENAGKAPHDYSAEIPYIIERPPDDSEGDAAGVKQPVEQGEPPLDKDCKCCGYACRGFLCDYCFRERLIDSGHQCKLPSTPAPSQPEFEDSDAGDLAALYAQRHNVKLERETQELREWKAEQLAVESTWDDQAVGKALGLQWGQPIRSAILPGIQHLQQQVEDERGIKEAEKKILIAEIEAHTALKQQLAQIKAYKSERPKVVRPGFFSRNLAYYHVADVDPLLDQKDATIAALRLDNVAKDARIAEANEGRRLALNKVAGLEQRLAELEGGK